MKGFIKTRVLLDIHPDGDIYAYNKEVRSYQYIGFLDNEGDPYSKDYRDMEKRADRIFKMNEVK